MKLFLILSAFAIAGQAAVPVAKILEDDVAAAMSQVHDVDIVTLELANALQYYNLRVDLEIKPISVEIIEQLKDINVTEADVTLMEANFKSSFDLIQGGVRDLDNRLRNLRGTTGAMTNSLQSGNWNNLRYEEKRFRDDTKTIEDRFNTTITNLRSSLTTLETDLHNILIDQSSEDFAAVFSNWGQIVDIFEFAGREVTDWKIVYDARVVSTKNAIDAVLDQVFRRRPLQPLVKSDRLH